MHISTYYPLPTLWDQASSDDSPGNRFLGSLAYPVYDTSAMHYLASGAVTVWQLLQAYQANG